MARKRANGEGAVRRQKNGSWRAQIMDGYHDDGSRNLVGFKGATKSEVIEQIREYWNQKEISIARPNSSMSFEEWANVWYADYQTQVQASTYAGYQYTLKLLKAHFGPKPICDIKALDINRFIDSLSRKGMSRSYITKCRSMLIQIFDGAEANEVTPNNPARKSKMIKLNYDELDDSHGKKDAFTEFEIKQMKKYLPDDILGHSILLMLGTGLRCQELLCLTPNDIAYDGSSVSVSKAIKTVGGSPTLGPPKSKRGKRVIPVPLGYREHALYLRAHSGKPYVWTSRRENGLYDVGAFRRRYYHAIGKIAGVRKLSPHCCRHTYISNLEKGGVPMELIARLAGHTRITTTDGYLHTDMDTLANAVAVLNGK